MIDDDDTLEALALEALADEWLALEFAPSADDCGALIRALAQ